MNTFKVHMTNYLEYCKYRKRLNSKTLKAYCIDLKQYEVFCSTITDFTSRDTVDLYNCQAEWSISNRINS